MTYIRRKTFTEKIERKRKKARELYASGYTTREIGKRLKRSKAWVAEVVKDGDDNGQRIDKPLTTI